MLRFSAFLLSAVLLIWPAAAQAQTPAKSLVRRVSLQVTFIVVKTSDLDALGTNFDFVAIPEVPKQFLAIVTGTVAAQSYQDLTGTASVKSHVFTLAPAVVSDGVPTTFTVHAQFTDVADEMLPKQDKSFPRLTTSRQIDGTVTLVPHMGPGDLISLDIDSPFGKSQRINLGAVPSGRQIIINTAVVQAQEESRASSYAPFILGMGRNTVSEAKELLLFVTPTILAGTPGRAVVSAPEKLITVDVSNEELQTALLRLGRQYQFQYIIKDGVDAHRVIGASASVQPLTEALRFLASAVDAQVTRNSDGVYVFALRPAGSPQRRLFPNRPQFQGGF